MRATSTIAIITDSTSLVSLAASLLTAAVRVRAHDMHPFA